VLPSSQTSPFRSTHTRLGNSPSASGLRTHTPVYPRRAGAIATRWRFGRNPACASTGKRPGAEWLDRTQI
jgi:hypothetical protein